VSPSGNSQTLGVCVLELNVNVFCYFPFLFFPLFFSLFINLKHMYNRKANKGINNVEFKSLPLTECDRKPYLAKTKFLMLRLIIET
jgi:hypothetical protein